MAGERELRRLLAGMRPRLAQGSWVVNSVENRTVPAGVRPFATVDEEEGLTLVLRRAEADAAGLPYEFVAALITLEVHSDLAAVGLTAAVSTRLADAGISCNVLAGFFHDHLLVPWERADEAVALLRALAGGSEP